MKTPSLVLALLLLSASSCSPPVKKCTPASCATGCCDAAGECQPGSAANACGQLGSTCQMCTLGQACNLGICGSTSGGGGGSNGGGSGGGSGGGVTGGGTGGGVTGGGTGGGVTGGGTGGGVTGGGGGSTCDGCLYNGSCIIRANSNNNTVCGEGGVVCATCTFPQNCVNYVCTGASGGGAGGGATGGGTGGGATGGGTGGGVTGGGAGGSGGETCSLAARINTGTLIGSTTGMLNHYDPGCTGDVTPGPDAVYVISVPAGQRLTAAAAPDVVSSGSQYDLAVYLIAGPASNCVSGPLTCLSASDDPNTLSSPESTGYFNGGGAPVDVFIVIDSYFGMGMSNPDGGIGAASEGRYTLTTSLAAPSTGDRCDTAVLLTAGVPLANQNLANFGDDYDGTGANCVGSSSADATYQVVVPAGQLLNVTVTPGATYDPVLSVADNAAACSTTCVAGVDVGLEGDAEVYTYTNATGASRTLFLVVDGYAGSTGTFSIGATLATPQPDDACGGATLLTAGATLSGQTTTGYSNDYENGTGATGCSGNGVTGPDRVYQVTVPNAQRAVVTVTPVSSAYNPSLNLVSTPASVCAAQPRVCVAGSNLAGTGLAETVSVFNTSGLSRSYFAIVDSASGGGDFSIGFTSAVPPANDTCTTNNLTLTAGTRPADDLTGFIGDYGSGTGCYASGGPDRAYRVQLSANQKYTFTVTPTGTGGFDPVVNLIPGPASNCEAAPRTCRGGADATLGDQPETGAFTNNTGAALDLYVIVGDYETTSTSRAFSLVTGIGAAPAGESCGVPLATSAGTLAGQTTAGASSDVVISPSATTCVRTGVRVDRVHSITVPAGLTLTVTATPVAMEDLMVNVIDGASSFCNDVTACAASSDTGVDGVAETAMFTNSTGAAKTVFVQVAAYGTGVANYSLTVQIQ